jgi:hypothetical protein
LRVVHGFEKSGPVRATVFSIRSKRFAFSSGVAWCCGDRGSPPAARAPRRVLSRPKGRPPVRPTCGEAPAGVHCPDAGGPALGTPSASA